MNYFQRADLERIVALMPVSLVTVKLPFPLTIRFKSMLQSGVATRDLDVRWVSSLSWYFLNLFGLQSVFIFILGDDNGTESFSLRFYTALLTPHSGQSDGAANVTDEPWSGRRHVSAWAGSR